MDAMSRVLIYVIASLLIGLVCELEAGDRLENTVLKTSRAVGYAVGWPLLLCVSAWFRLTLDEEEPYW